MAKDTENDLPDTGRALQLPHTVLVGICRYAAAEPLLNSLAMLARTNREIHDIATPLLNRSDVVINSFATMQQAIRRITVPIMRTERGMKAKRFKPGSKHPAQIERRTTHVRRVILYLWDGSDVPQSWVDSPKPLFIDWANFSSTLLGYPIFPHLEQGSCGLTSNAFDSPPPIPHGDDLFAAFAAFAFLAASGPASAEIGKPRDLCFFTPQSLCLGELLQTMGDRFRYTPSARTFTFHITPDTGDCQDAGEHGCRASRKNFTELAPDWYRHKGHHFFVTVLQRFRAILAEEQVAHGNGTPSSKPSSSSALHSSITIRLDMPPNGFKLFASHFYAHLESHSSDISEEFQVPISRETVILERLQTCEICGVGNSYAHKSEQTTLKYTRHQKPMTCDE